MKCLQIACGVAVVFSSQRVAALHLLNTRYTIPQNGELQFSHMGKVYPQEQKNLEGKPKRSQGVDSTEVTEEPASSNNERPNDYVQGGSERSMDNVPVSDMTRPNHKVEGSNGGPANNNTSTSNTTNNTSGPTTSDNRVDNTKTYNHSITHGRTTCMYGSHFVSGASNYKGDTSTYVTNNFFNPPIQDGAWEEYPKGASLELEYLWKRINVIDDKLDKLLPIGGIDPKLDPNKRKGLIITFDAQSDPDRPTVDVESKGTDYDIL